MKPIVTILCKCGRAINQFEMYFCLNCKDFLCPFCVNVEFDSLMCYTCHTEIPFSEATGKNNIYCKSCLKCPLCLQLLKKVTSKSQKKEREYPFFLYCNFCHWNSYSNKTLIGKTAVDFEGKLADQITFGKPYNEEFDKLLQLQKDLQKNKEKNQGWHSSIGLKSNSGLDKKFTNEDLKNMINSKINRPPSIDPNNLIVGANQDYFDKLENLNVFQTQLLSLSQRFLAFNLNETNSKQLKCELGMLRGRKIKKCTKCNIPLVQYNMNRKEDAVFKFDRMYVYYLPHIKVAAIFPLDTDIRAVYIELINSSACEFNINLKMIQKSKNFNFEFQPLKDEIHLSFLEADKDLANIIVNLQELHENNKNSQSLIVYQRAAKNAVLVKLVAQVALEDTKQMGGFIMNTEFGVQKNEVISTIIIEFNL